MPNYQHLSIEELLKIVLLEKKSEYVTTELVNKFKSLDELLIGANELELQKINGLGVKRSQQLKAISEIARRLYSKSYTSNDYKISKPQDVANLLMADMAYLKREVFKVVLLNTKNFVIDIIDISVGSLNSSLVHPRETFLEAIKRSAANIIAVHNHPSGDSTPSSEDVNITKRLAECGKLLGINLLDHIVFGRNNYISLKEKGVI